MIVTISVGVSTTSYVYLPDLGQSTGFRLGWRRCSARLWTCGQAWHPAAPRRPERASGEREREAENDRKNNRAMLAYAIGRIWKVANTPQPFPLLFKFRTSSTATEGLSLSRAISSAQHLVSSSTVQNPPLSPFYIQLTKRPSLSSLHKSKPGQLWTIRRENIAQALLMTNRTSQSWYHAYAFHEKNTTRY